MNRNVLVRVALASLVCAAAVAGCSSTGQATTSPAATSSPGLAADQIKITFGENAQVEIVGPTGRRIMIDVWDPETLSAPPTKNDILLTTHMHDDHYIATFVSDFPGQSLTFEKGPLKLEDIAITGISALHDEGQADGSDYIYVIDVAGFRIAHFGDLGQDKLTDEQLAAIGKVDIAFSQLSNQFSSMDDTNRKGLKLMNQVKPKLLIPTHLSGPTAQLAAAEWQATFSAGPITIRHDQLPAQTTICFAGSQAGNYASLLNLAPPSW